MSKRGPRGAWPTPMTFHQLARAAELFLNCEYSTLEIAEALHVSEADVYNNMAFIHAAGAIHGGIKKGTEGKEGGPLSI